MEFRVSKNEDEIRRKWMNGDPWTECCNKYSRTALMPPAKSANGLLRCKMPSPGKQSPTAAGNVNVRHTRDFIARGRKSKFPMMSECDTPKKRPRTSNRQHSNGSPSGNELSPRDMERATMIDSMREFRKHKMPVPKSKNELLYNAKVQLVKLEQICDKFQDYSASEIELLTDRYINLLMNSNFSCVTKSKSKLISLVKHKPSSVEDELSCWSAGFLNKVNDEDALLSEEIIEEIIVIANTKQGPGVQYKQHSTNTTDNEQEIVSFQNLNLTQVGKEDPHELEDLNSDLSLLVKNEDGIKIEENEVKVKEELQEIEEVNEIRVKEEGVQEIEVKEEVKEENEHSLKIIALDRPATVLECTDNNMTFVTKNSLNQHQNCKLEVETESNLKNAIFAESHLKPQKPSASNNFSSINIPLKDLKVDLIRLEAICNNFDDYSATELDNLINGNSSEAIFEKVPQPLQQGGTINFVPIKPIKVLCNKPCILCSCHTLNSSNQELGIEIVLLCKICNVVFRRRECFEAHNDFSPQCRLSLEKDQSTRIPKLLCSDCPWLLDSLPKMHTHLQIHARQNYKGNVSFSCNICKIQFFGIGNIFHQHWYEHSGFPNFVANKYWFQDYAFEDPNLAITSNKDEEKFLCVAEYVCPECKLFFNSETALQEHKLRYCKFSLVVPKTNAAVDNEKIKIICQLCQLCYNTKEKFDRHCVVFNHVMIPKISYLEVSVTLTQRVFVCTLCDLRISTSIEGMERHWKQMHSLLKTLYTCNVCKIDVNFTSNPSLYTFEKFKKHCLIKHKNETTKCLVYFHIARYACVICKYGFANQTSLRKHQVLHENVLEMRHSTPSK